MGRVAAWNKRWVTGVTQDATASPAGTTDVWIGAAMHRVPYDIEAVAEAMAASGLPVTLVEAPRRA